MRKLGFHSLIASRRGKEQDRVVAMVASRILNPESQLAFSRSWKNATLGEALDIGTREGDLYTAMDWLYERQDIIEKKLAKRHLKPGDQVVYDLSSSYFEGQRARWVSAAIVKNRKKVSCR